MYGAECSSLISSVPSFVYLFGFIYSLWRGRRKEKVAQIIWAKFKSDGSVSSENCWVEVKQLEVSAGVSP